MNSEDNKMKEDDLSIVSLLERKCEEIYKIYMPIRAKGASEQYDISEYTWYFTVT